MNNPCKTVAISILVLGLLSSATIAQGTMQTVGLVRVDPATVTKGYRTSHVVGSTVMNEAREIVGTIDDLIVTPNDNVPFAILSVGGFLGMGTRLVVVPSNLLKVVGRDMILPGATKESLRALPEFKYAL